MDTCPIHVQTWCIQRLYAQNQIELHLNAARELLPYCQPHLPQYEEARRQHLEMAQRYQEINDRSNDLAANIVQCANNRMYADRLSLTTE